MGRQGFSPGVSCAAPAALGCPRGKRLTACLHPRCNNCSWPVKSCEFLLGLLKNAESNAEVSGAAGLSPLHTVHGVAEEASTTLRPLNGLLAVPNGHGCMACNPAQVLTPHQQAAGRRIAAGEPRYY